MAAELESELARLEEELKLALVEKDPADEKDVIVEIRPGVGGDEAALWAGDLYRMLTRYAERRRFKTETLSASENETGGFKEVVFAVKGDGAFSVFKYEGGTHRVQRVPETESQGRIHTSTATVAVMPEVEEVEVQIDEKDLKIDVMRSTGPGGQSVNTTDSAVRITHLPTGMVVAMQDEKSQLQNKQKALRVLRARLYELERGKQQAELAATRRSQIGGGERAEKIRTYNFPENRLTDHRIKLTVHRLDNVLEGELGRVHRGAPGRGPPAGARCCRNLTAGRAGGTTDERGRRDGDGGARSCYERLAAAGCETPRVDAEILLAHVLRTSRAGLLRRQSPLADDRRGARAPVVARSPCAPRAARVRARRSGGFAGSRCTSTPASSFLGRRRRSSSSGASHCSRARPSRACSTSAPGAVPSRWRSRTSIPARG